MKPLEALFAEAAGGDKGALDFLWLWHEQRRQAQKLLAIDAPNPQGLLEVLANANLVYSCPFYQRHVLSLQSVAARVISSDIEGIDLGVEMVLAVALLAGGWDAMRKLSTTARAIWSKTAIDEPLD